MFKGNTEVIICEGEKDADTITRLKIAPLATSAPAGKGSWPDVLTPYFKDFKKVSFIYDVGAEKDARIHAGKLKKAYPKIEVFIIKVPLEKEGADITDYLSTMKDLKQRQIAFSDLLIKGEKFTPRPGPSLEPDDVADPISTLLLKDIPPIEYLIKPMVERSGYTLIGAMKGVGKSLFATQMALHYASGKSPFLHEGFPVEKPGKVLLIQQEVSKRGMKDRLVKMTSEQVFIGLDNFHEKTTTGNIWDLTKPEDFNKAVVLIEKYQPDMLILDPLYTFCLKDINSPAHAAPLIKILLELKSNYGLALVIVHHFSNKSQLELFINVVGRFMGSSNITNAADITIAMDFLPPNFKKEALAQPYHHYCSLEVGTRHGEWPQKIFLERRGEDLLFHKSDVWEDIGKKIIPGQVENYLRANDGEALQKDVLAHFAVLGASPTTSRRAIDEAIEQGKITKEALPGKGNPIILRTTI